MKEDVISGSVTRTETFWLGVKADNAGPLAQAAGHDLNYVALTGMLSLSSHRGERPIVPPTVVGDAAGALGLAFGMVCAAAGVVIDATRQGSTAEDSLSGGAGNDRIYSHWGDDTLRGGDGDDVLVSHRHELLRLRDRRHHC
jgi:hypothetical protein